MTSKLIVQKTPLHENHLQRGAKMTDFAGWEMPLQFSKVIAEHMAVRQAAGLFDISHMGLVRVTSGNAEATRRFIDAMVPQDIGALYPGKAAYTQFLNEAGGIIDDIIVYYLPEQLHFSDFNEFLIICNAANVDEDVAWMRSHASADIQIRPMREYGLLALQGPRFSEILQLLGVSAEAIPKRFHVAEIVLDGNTPVLAARTGYTGEDGVELIIPWQDIEKVWNRLLEKGAPLGLLPIGLAARDTLRLEAAYPLHGHDISEKDTPLEAGLGWSVKLNKATNFIGKEALLSQQRAGLVKKFTCFKLKKKVIPRQHDILLKDGDAIGEVTSGSISPILNEPIGMGYVAASVPLEAGATLQVRIRNMDVDAEVIERPFYKRRPESV